jgi:predicted O-methyltransferase YrrM
VRSVRSWIPERQDLDWIEATAVPIHPVLAAIEDASVPDEVPIVDRSSGRVLSVVAASRRRIVEVGTAIGYSTLWMALAMPADGSIVTIDPDTTRTAAARASWRAAGIADDRIVVVGAKALDAFRDRAPELDGPFDLAFIDALKPEYAGYLDELIPRLEAGALVLADNVLWSGRTSGGRPEREGDNTEHLRAFCRRVLRDPRFTSTILPVGDGLLFATFRG